MTAKQEMKRRYKNNEEISVESDSYSRYLRGAIKYLDHVIMYEGLDRIVTAKPIIHNYDKYEVVRCDPESNKFYPVLINPKYLPEIDT